MIDLDTLASVSAAIAGRTLSVPEYVAHLLDRIERLEPALNAFVFLDADRLLAEAGASQAAVDAGRALGPLHGVPIGIKDLIDVAGMPTRAGSSFFRRNPQSDAPLVANLRAAGALIAGKLNTHEFAWGITTDNPHFGRTCNPWNPQRIAGGSSGGSGAAVSAGMLPGAIGSDTMGSVRIPAGFNGLTGLRPAVGTIPMDGIFALTPAFDVAGPLAHDAADVAVLVAAMRGGPAREAIDVGARPRIARLRGEPWSDVVAEVDEAVAAVARVLAQSGCAVEDVTFGQSGLAAIAGTIQMRAAALIHREFFSQHRAEYGDDVRARLEMANGLDDGRFQTALAAREAARGEFLAAMRGYDLILIPALPFEAPPAKTDPVTLNGRALPLREAVMPFTATASSFGLPALAFPCGFGSDGLPLSAQLVSPHGDESAVLAGGGKFQRETDWHERRPALSTAA